MAKIITGNNARFTSVGSGNIARTVLCELMERPPGQPFGPADF